MEEPGWEQAELAGDGMGRRQWGRRLHIDIAPPGPQYWGLPSSFAGLKDSSAARAAWCPAGSPGLPSLPVP